MKFVIYGVSRSGKDYLIEKIVNHINTASSYNAIHLKGSEMLESQSLLKFNKPFKVLSEDQKNILRRDFAEIVKEREKTYQVVFVDGHYSFIEGSEYEIVFTEADKNVYDAFFYLDTPSELIKKYSRNSKGYKKNTAITESDIRKWKKFEKNGLSEVCKELNKELIILDEDTSSCISFFDWFICNDSGRMYSPGKTAEKLLKNISAELCTESTVFLMDCDKTLSENDVTYQFCKHLEIDGSLLKKIFYNDRYSLYQFYKVSRLYSIKSRSELDEAARIASKGLILNKKILSDSNNRGYRIGLTSGIYSVWKESSANNDIFDSLIGCSDYNSSPLLVTPQVKKEIVSLLKKMGKIVYAVGDSMIDVPMLEEADKSYIVAHQKLSKAVCSYFSRVTITKIKQLEYSQYKYPGIAVMEAMI